MGKNPYGSTNREEFNSALGIIEHFTAEVTFVADP